jgi:hypothetical protein
MAIFAEALEMANTQLQIELRPPGHIAIEERERGGRYAIWVRTEGKKLSREYLGTVESPEHQEAEAQLVELKRFRDQAKDLRKLGFASVENEAAQVIAQLANTGVFSGGGILVGTRAFGAILNQLGYSATPLLGTQDVDVARLHSIRLAAPLPDGGILELLKQTGLRFVPVMGLERPPEPPTSYKVVGGSLKVDLLIPTRPGVQPYAAVPVTELGTHATALPFLEYLIDEPWSMLIIGRDHLVPVRCPNPARYCLHKLAIAALRTGNENPKVEKDLIQAGMLAAILATEDAGMLESAASPLPMPMRKHIRKSLPRLEKLLISDHLAAWSTIQHLLVR